jgi:hypothetical protein
MLFKQKNLSMPVSYKVLRLTNSTYYYYYFLNFYIKKKKEDLYLDRRCDEA